ncbi:HypC/HybG/HupF family hydrogenase formation chaperone [Sulfurimonas aquatica]|uniref:HypC/HybG/HupF family hydrogenase formation chaperone n=1 Tax=Sulfurimonas aquatica TaxID=2672570 RepID=A0A975B0I6_9BACT|nr:HypC/HybG/HupF family hydrogenase formation chaperone [Sulfurimonas aquatica]QSZ41967.1 HypC/HybG/HupF family hydrogenase formation chaperone [Sulfurimonas aquatica]
MCLSIPSKIIEIDEDNNATVDTMGVKRQVSLDLMGDDVGVGDYILIHVGFAMNKIDEKDALDSLELYAEIVEKMEEEEKRQLIEDEKVNGEAREAPLGDDNCSNRGQS